MPSPLATQPQRRALTLPDLDALLVEMEKIIASERAGTLRRTGNWTVGQTFGHLAGWVNYNYVGYPFKLPWFLRGLVAMQLRHAIRNGFPAGVKIPGVTGGTYAIAPLTTEEGAERLRDAVGKLQRGEPLKYPNPAFGFMPLEMCVRATLGHAALHLSFLHPDGR